MAAGGTVDVAHGQRRTVLVSVAVAALLVALKLGVGLLSASLGLISAGIESSGDVVAALLTFFAVQLGGRPADPGHPYGHRRAENLGALGESAILLAGGVLVTVEAISRLAGDGRAPETSWYVFAVIGCALVLDASRTSVSLAAARRYRSPALRSNAFHFAADMAGSAAVLAGLLAVRGGLREGDAIAALLVAGLIFAAAARLIVVNANILMDRTPTEARAAAERAIAAVGDGVELSRLRLRESAGRYFADVVVSVPAGQAVVEGHRSADRIEQAVEAALPGSDVVVHVEPRARGLELRDRVLAIALSEPLVREAHDITVFEQDAGASVSLHLKFPAGLGLEEAHTTATRIERAIGAQPGVSDVQTHLEPLERPLTTLPADVAAERDAVAEVVRVVHQRTGAEPRRVRLFDTDAGRVLFLTVPVASGTLADAHRLASELEEDLRRRIPDIAEAVVHTEP